MFLLLLNYFTLNLSFILINYFIKMLSKVLCFYIFLSMIIPKMECYTIQRSAYGECTSNHHLLFPLITQKYDNIDLTGLVMVTSRCRTDTCDHIFDYPKITCFGFVIHPQIVLTLSNCVPQNEFTRFVKIRSYPWSQSNNQIDASVVFKTLNVSQIINYPDVKANSENQINNLAAVILSTPLKIQPLFELASNNIDTKNCFIIDSVGFNFIGEFTLDQFRPFIFETSKSGFDKCFVKNKKDLLFKNTFCAYIPTGFYCGGNIGNPYLCRSKENATKHLLQGILIDRENQTSAYFSTDNITHWIESIKTNYFNTKLERNPLTLTIL